MIDHNSWYVIPKNCLIINDRIIPCSDTERCPFYLNVNFVNKRIYVNGNDYAEIGVLDDNYVFELTDEDINLEYLESLNIFDHSSIGQNSTATPNTTTSPNSTVTVTVTYNPDSTTPTTTALRSTTPTTSSTATVTATNIPGYNIIYQGTIDQNNGLNVYIDYDCENTLDGHARRIDNGNYNTVVNTTYLNEGDAIIGVEYVSLHAYNEKGFSICGGHNDILSPLMNAYIYYNDGNVDVTDWTDSIAYSFCGCSGANITIKEYVDTTSTDLPHTTPTTTEYVTTPTTTSNKDEIDDSIDDIAPR